ncbi:hypothetical protein PAXY110619_14360 [Paenibacillus xylanexedens]|uniref:Uncharacterized protein n=1 Tax=Paenibacillus xylanexedens TaxID=528191 RepID=A0ABS4RQU6_PAEXY|nr:hypothetical protein [Paenibacillus xylanexedens]
MESVELHGFCLLRSWVEQSDRYEYRYEVEHRVKKELSHRLKSDVRGQLFLFRVMGSVVQHG